MSDALNLSHERRKNTRNRVYNYIYSCTEPCSKKDVSTSLDLSMPTVYQNVDSLVESGLIEYCGQKDSSGGRPAMNMRAVYDFKSAIGVYISSDYLQFVSTDLSREETGHKTVFYYGFELGEDDFSEFLLKELESFIEDVNIDRSKLLGVGISIPGIILQDSRDIQYVPILALRNIPLDEIAKKIPYPVYFENDANSSGFAEWYNASESNRSIAYLSLHDGVGGSVIVNGGQYSGNNNRAGEFGHMCVEYDGLECACGKKGCLEAYCSPKRLSTDIGMTLQEFFGRLEEDDDYCAALWEKYTTYLAIGIHNIRMALDCEIVLGGSMSEYLGHYLSDIKEKVSEMDSFTSDCSYLSISRYLKNSSMLGVALHFIKDFLDGI